MALLFTSKALCMQNTFDNIYHFFRQDWQHTIIEISLLAFIAIYFFHKKTFKPKKPRPLSLEV